MAFPSFTGLYRLYPVDPKHFNRALDSCIRDMIVRGFD